MQTNEMIEQVWDNEGFELADTGGGFWAGQKTLRGILFKISDYHQSPYPNPDGKLVVSAYLADSHEWLDFTQDVDSLQAAIAKLPEWAEMLAQEK